MAGAIACWLKQAQPPYCPSSPDATMSRCDSMTLFMIKQGPRAEDRLLDCKGGLHPCPDGRLLDEPRQILLLPALSKYMNEQRVYVLKHISV